MRYLVGGWVYIHYPLDGLWLQIGLFCYFVYNLYFTTRLYSILYRIHITLRSDLPFTVTSAKTKLAAHFHTAFVIILQCANLV